MEVFPRPVRPAVHAKHKVNVIRRCGHAAVLRGHKDALLDEVQPPHDVLKHIALRQCGVHKCAAVLHKDLIEEYCVDFARHARYDLRGAFFKVSENDLRAEKHVVSLRHSQAVRQQARKQCDGGIENVHRIVTPHDDGQHAALPAWLLCKQCAVSLAICDEGAQVTQHTHCERAVGVGRQELKHGVEDDGAVDGLLSGAIHWILH
mmetsp:Transcript_28464/g.71504  ORF Transcript_28464/g.71504 Transcript_28464/m.71504 type:complete len:205 (+) Transcript_28464:3520-4134(+)